MSKKQCNPWMQTRSASVTHNKMDMKSSSARIRKGEFRSKTEPRAKSWITDRLLRDLMEQS